jgi:hypothetical protein
MDRRQGHRVTDDEMTRGPASMTLDACADLDDVTVTLDAAIRAATEKARQDATSEFARDGTEGLCSRCGAALCGRCCGLTAGLAIWLGAVSYGAVIALSG